ncbi:hypothetical protein GCM10010329_52490 [Streptomyces spiroverticillatus]|uniref:BioF2-like acetyltransferase domain-containing protein n=1 Tax=Streptomyces finlayi TaxID=67296 RepID=A0A919CCE8_9ACTN|nr:GNAT family N-acetyltransferase [Streptomyces finlayi]GHA22634.1 hypothetical protein GCM10010329_52490 [Streptomyces spiroverticillatus]GHD04513.1 hypothetical protein GCM10010334_53430 [Streptomyces finlayi]
MNRSAAPRQPLPRRAALRARYAWDQHPRLAALRTRTDALRAPFRALTPLDAPLRLAYSGVPEGRLHLLPFLEGQGVPAAPLATFPLHTPAPDLLIRGVRTVPDPSPASVLMPFRVRLAVSLESGWRQRISRRERRAFAANQRENGWSWQESRDPADFDFFYRRMHLPTMRQRHGESTRSAAPDLAYECLFRRGVLFFLVQDGQRVAGVLCALPPGERRLTMRLLGVLDGAPEHYASGAVKALTHFALEWAAERGFAEVDLSGSEPFLSKGIFQFKQRFHPVCSLPLDHFGRKRAVLRVLRDSPRVRDFLVANPLLTIPASGDGFEAVYFHDGARPARTAQLAWQCPGVERAVEVDLDAFLASVPERATA